jgi:Bacterial SH3 domain
MSMIRKAAAVVVVLCLSSASLHADSDSVKLTVSAASAAVYKSPSVGSPVLGQASRGMALDVTREVGDWVKVAWPSAPDGVGYVRTNMGSISRGAAAPATAPSAPLAPAPSVATSAPMRPAPASPSLGTRADQQPVVRSSAPSPASTMFVAPTHTIGFGARIGGSSLGVGGSVRGWPGRRLGAQFDVSHYAMSSLTQVGSFSATQFGPSVLFAMNDRVTDTMWMRPYLGAGLDISHATLSNITPGVSETSNTMGYRIFGGGELTLSGLPQFGVSLDIGYYQMPAPFVGWETKGFGAAVSGHWYPR